MTLRCLLLVSIALTGTAAAAPVAISDLQGRTVEVSSSQDQRVRRQGREFNVKTRRDFSVVVRSPEIIQVTVRNSAEGPMGRREGQPQSGLFDLGKEREVSSAGGGSARWSYEDSAFTFMRTFREGALKLTVTVSLENNKLACSAVEAFAKEERTGGITMNSVIDGAPVRILSAKQSASACKVVDKP